MKNLYNYIVLLLLCANCCSKPPTEGASAKVDTIGNTHVESPISPAEEYNIDDANSQNFALDSSSAISDSAVFPNLTEVKIVDSSTINLDDHPKISKDHNNDVIQPNLTAVSTPNLHHPDNSTLGEVINDSKPKSAVLGFSYFPKIAQNETRDLRVFVKIQGDGSQVKSRLRAIEKEDYEFTKTDDSSVICIIKNIEAFNKLSIKPINDTEDLKIIRVDDERQGIYGSDPDEQILDFNRGNYWH